MHNVDDFVVCLGNINRHLVRLIDKLVFMEVYGSVIGQKVWKIDTQIFFFKQQINYVLLQKKH